MQTSVKVFVLCLILCISLVTALQFGAKFISLDQIISALMSMIDANTTASVTNTIITDIRLPRLIYSVLTGIGLSLVGLLMQTVTRNALADPYVLGVSFATLLILLILSGTDRQKTRIQTKRKSGGRCGEETPFLPPQMEYLSLL